MVICLFCRDENLLDVVIPDPTLIADLIIDIDNIIYAAESLRDVTAFLSDVKALDEIFPVIKTSINEVIAGSDRTIADLFDFTCENTFLKLCEHAMWLEH